VQQQVLGHTLAKSRAQTSQQAKALDVEKEIMVSKSHADRRTQSWPE